MREIQQVGLVVGHWLAAFRGEELFQELSCREEELDAVSIE